MENLGFLDQLFYKAEQYRVTTVCMGGACILAPATPGEVLDGETIASHLAARLERIPLMRAKLVQDLLRIGSVCKVEDPDFQIWDHIEVGSIAEPGGYRELTEAIALLSSTPLDSGQLWRWNVLQGLRGGRVAVVSKIHHALADGIGIGKVLSSLYDTWPVTPEMPTHAAPVANDQPSALALLGSAIAQNANRFLLKTPRFMLKHTGPALAAIRATIRDRLAAKPAAGSPFALPKPRGTSLNVGACPGRRSLAYKTLSLIEVKHLARHFDCKVNDIGLLLYSFAMQHYFEIIGETIDFDLICGMPISTRTERSAAGNQVGFGLINLHNTVELAAERLRAISRDAANIKNSARQESHLPDIEEVGGLIFPPILDGLLFLAGRFRLFARIGDAFPVFNALLSNVPGPSMTLFIGNGKQLEVIPLIPAIDVIAVSGGIASMGDCITIGFHCDGKAVEDPELFIKGVELGLRKLRAARGSAGEPRGRTGSTKPKRGRATNHPGRVRNSKKHSRVDDRAS